MYIVRQYIASSIGKWSLEWLKTILGELILWKKERENIAYKQDTFFISFIYCLYWLLMCYTIMHLVYGWTILSTIFSFFIYNSKLCINVKMNRILRKIFVFTLKIFFIFNFISPILQNNITTFPYIQLYKKKSRKVN